MKKFVLPGNKSVTHTPIMRGLPVASFSAAVEAELSIAPWWESTDFYHRVSERPKALEGRTSPTRRQEI